MAAMQHVEHAVGEYNGRRREAILFPTHRRGRNQADSMARNRAEDRDPVRLHAWAEACALMLRVNSLYSNSLTTRATRVVAAICVRLRPRCDCEAHQIDDPSFGDNLDVRRRELARLDKLPLTFDVR
jgi:hypothetical protein